MIKLLQKVIFKKDFLESYDESSYTIVHNKYVICYSI